MDAAVPSNPKPSRQAWIIAGLILLAASLVAGTVLVLQRGPCAAWQGRFRSVLAEFDASTPSPDGNEIYIDAQPYENLTELGPPPHGCVVPRHPSIRTFSPRPESPRIRG